MSDQSQTGETADLPLQHFGQIAAGEAKVGRDQPGRLRVGEPIAGEGDRRPGPRTAHDAALSTPRVGDRWQSVGNSISSPFPASKRPGLA